MLKSAAGMRNGGLAAGRASGRPDVSALLVKQFLGNSYNLDVLPDAVLYNSYSLDVLPDAVLDNSYSLHVLPDAASGY